MINLYAVFRDQFMNNMDNPVLKAAETWSLVQRTYESIFAFCDQEFSANDINLRNKNNMLLEFNNHDTFDHHCIKRKNRIYIGINTIDLDIVKSYIIKFQVYPSDIMNVPIIEVCPNLRLFEFIRNIGLDKGGYFFKGDAIGKLIFILLKTASEFINTEKRDKVLITDNLSIEKIPDSMNYKIYKELTEENNND